MIHMIVAFDRLHRVLEIRETDDPRTAYHSWSGMKRALLQRGQNVSWHAMAAIPMETRKIQWFRLEHNPRAFLRGEMVLWDRAVDPRY